MGLLTVPESCEVKANEFEIGYLPPRKKTSTPPAGSPELLFSARMASRAFSIVLNGELIPPLFASFPVSET